MNLQGDDDHRATAHLADPGAEREESAMARGIGKVLRELRKKRNLSLNDLARVCGVSRSMLSQMETGRSTPSVVVLCKIARTFDIPVTAFIEPQGAEKPMLVSGEDTPLRISADGKCAWRSLAPGGHDRKMEFYEITLRGGGIEQVKPYREGTWANLAISGGNILVALDGCRHRLTSGDVLEFPASKPHSYINPGNAEALMFLVLRHPDSLA